jgi:flagellar M-ring protein FliF
MAGINDAIEQGKQFWATRTPLQKRYLLAGRCGHGASDGLFVRLIGTPDYKPLSNGSGPAGVQKLPRNWMRRAFPIRPARTALRSAFLRISWPRRTWQTASLGPSHSGRTGFELFDKMSWGQTEFDQKVTYQRAWKASWSGPSQRWRR